MDVEDLKRRFGQRVQALRRQRGLTQEQLAEAIGKSTDTVSNIETGRLSTRIETAMKLAEVLGVSLSDLFDIGDVQPPSDRDRRRATEELVRLMSSLPTERIEKVTRLVRMVLDL